MIRVYFDTNIFEDIVKGKIDISIKKLNSFKNINYYISTAHIEEYYIAIKNDIQNKYSVDNQKRKDLMTELKCNGILNPSRSQIVNFPENFDTCLQRVKEYDTTELIKERSIEIHKSRYNFYNNLIKEQAKAKNYSNLTPEKIWEESEIKSSLSKIGVCIKLRSFQIYLDLINIYGLETVPKLKSIDDSKLYKSCFKEIHNQYFLMETIFEYLHALLNKYGYNADKNVQTVTSGVYDIAHSIYGTYCDYFVSNDTRLRKRISAIYYYLGVPTKVITFEEFLKIANKQ